MFHQSFALNHQAAVVVVVKLCKLSINYPGIKDEEKKIADSMRPVS